MRNSFNLRYYAGKQSHHHSVLWVQSVFILKKKKKQSGDAACSRKFGFPEGPHPLLWGTVQPPLPGRFGQLSEDFEPGTQMFRESGHWASISWVIASIPDCSQALHYLPTASHACAGSGMPWPSSFPSREATGKATSVGLVLPLQGQVGRPRRAQSAL